MFKPTLALFIALQISSVASAKDFALSKSLFKQKDNPTFDLTSGDAETFYNYIHSKIAPKMKQNGEGSEDNVTVLKSGGGVSVKLGEKNYNVHINFPASEMGGRSYGWTSGKVGDWSDSMYPAVHGRRDGRSRQKGNRSVLYGNFGCHGLVRSFGH